MKKNQIKVRLWKESVWATLQSDGTAVIDNMPLDPRVSYQDVVKIDHDNIFLSVIERTNRQCIIDYDGSSITREKWHEFNEYLEGKNIDCEGMTAGVAIAAFPKDMSEDTVGAILMNSPLEIYNIVFQPASALGIFD